MKKWMVVTLVLSLATGLFAELDKNEMFGRRVYDRKGDPKQSEQLDAKIYGIYFSAHWCPPCQKFSPVLVEAYNQIKKNGGAFEILFVSSDKSEAALFSYMEELKMPWLALKYRCSAANDLKEKYEVKGIPKLVIIDAEGNLITDNGQRDVQSLGAKAWEKWTKGGSGPVQLNGAVSLIRPPLKEKLKLTADQQTRIQEIVGDTSKQFKAEKNNGADDVKLDAIRNEALEMALELLTQEQRAVLADIGVLKP